MRRLLANRWLAGAVLVVLAGSLGFELARLGRDDGLPTPSAAETRVARDFAVAITTLDYRQIDAAKARLAGFAADSYRADLLRALGPAFADEAVKQKRITSGTITGGPTLQGITGGRAVFFVSLSQQIASDGSTAPPRHVVVAILVTITRGASPLVTLVKPL